MGRFDRIVIVDWSARATPARGADSIWICALHADGRTRLENVPTRRQAESRLLELLDNSTGRTLLGVDFSFALPRGTVRAAGLGDNWTGLWQHLTDRLTDDHRNRNNRWDVAADLNRRIGTPHFWGVPARRATRHLTTTRPPAGTLPVWRHCELTMRSATGRPPMSTWQLLGAGSVGSQTLTGIPVLQRLRHHPSLADRLRIWPFETGLVPDPAAAPDAIVVAEVWPSTVAPDPDAHDVKDARQVLALTQHLGVLDRDGRLGERFAPTLEPTIIDDVVNEEGWVLH